MTCEKWHHCALVDARLPRTAVEGLDEFDRLQVLHEAAVGYLSEDRLDELTPGMRALTVLFVVVGGIDNGGFASLMYNETGRWTSEGIAAARLVGADGHAQLMETFVNTALGGEAAMSDADRDARLEAMADDEEAALNALDDDFYALPAIDSFLNAYVEAHADEFFSDVGSR